MRSRETEAEFEDGLYNSISHIMMDRVSDILKVIGTLHIASAWCPSWTLIKGSCEVSMDPCQMMS